MSADDAVLAKLDEIVADGELSAVERAQARMMADEIRAAALWEPLAGAFRKG